MNISELAKEAGFVPVSDTGGAIDWECSHKSLERFAALAFEAGVVQEREACAKVCDDLHHWAASCCAKDIRARGEK